MIKLEMTGLMYRAGMNAAMANQTVGLRMSAALNAMEPEAKRELAAELLRSASESEGYDVQ